MRLAVSVFLIFIFSFLIQVVNLSKPLCLYDEGIVFYGAQQILSGTLPYRDFWTMYSPAQFYVVALLFKLFGSSVLIGRLWELVIRAALVSSIYWLARKLLAEWQAILIWAISFCWLGLFGFFLYPVFSALLFAFLALGFLTNYFVSRQGYWLFLNGLLVGIVLLFRHDMGFYLLLSELVVLIGLLKLHLKMLKPFVLGVLLLPLPVFVWLLVNGAGSALFLDLIYFPVVVFPRFRALHWPSLLSFFSLDSLPFYFPFIVFIWAAIVILKKNREKQAWQDINFLSLVLLTLFGILLFNQARIRAGALHALPWFFVALIVFFLLITYFGPKGNAWQKLLVIMVASLLLVVPTLRVWHIWLRQPFWQTAFGYKFDFAPRANYFYVSSYEQQVLQYLKTQLPLNQKIFVGDVRHDKIFVNDVMLYYLAERQSVSRYHELHPGVVTTLPVQREIVKALEDDKAQCLVLLACREGDNEPNLSNISSGVTLLDDYIRAHYQVVKQFGNYFILRRL